MERWGERSDIHLCRQVRPDQRGKDAVPIPQGFYHDGGAGRFVKNNITRKCTRKSGILETENIA